MQRLISDINCTMDCSLLLLLLQCLITRASGQHLLGLIAPG